MQHENLTGEAALDRAPVGERLDPFLGDADRVDVVPMPAERAAPQTSAEQLHPVNRPRGIYPLCWAARMFKTGAGLITQAGGHRSNLRSEAWKSYRTKPG
jgi:hypothetical protein